MRSWSDALRMRGRRAGAVRELFGAGLFGAPPIAQLPALAPPLAARTPT